MGRKHDEKKQARQLKELQEKMAEMQLAEMERVRKTEVADEVARVRAEEEKVRADREKEKRRRWRAEKKAADAAHKANVVAILADVAKQLADDEEKWRQQELVLEEERRVREERDRRRKQHLKENEERRVADEEEDILSRKVGEKMAALDGAANPLGFLYDTYRPRASPDVSAADVPAAEKAAEDRKKAKAWQTASEAAAEASSKFLDLVKLYLNRPTPAPAASAASQATPTPAATSGTLDSIKLSETDQRAALEDV